MPVIATGRKHYSEVVAGTGGFEAERKVDYYFKRVPVRAASATDVEPVGIPLVWDNANSAYVVFLAQDISAVTGTNYPVAVAVGNKQGLGYNEADVTLNTTAVELTAYIRGEASILEAGIDFGAASAPNIALFKTALEKQGAVFTASAGPVVTSYV